VDEPIGVGHQGNPDGKRVDYDAVAETYARTRTLAPNVLAAWEGAVAGYFDDAAGRVLDVGAGTGQFANALTRWFGVEVVALEPSAAMRHVARRAGQDPRIRFVAGYCEAIPLATASVDRAWLSAVIHHFTDLDLAVGELRRVVQPGGLLLVRGFFADVPLAPRFAVFPGIDRSVAAFPSTRHVADVFARHGIHVLSHTDVVEVHDVPSRSWESRLRALRCADSLLGRLTDAEFESGIASLRALPPNDPEADAHPVTLRLLACRT
jgi:ubiquinone/menaquinone biosynthesis C-methylase UbiE